MRLILVGLLAALALTADAFACSCAAGRDGERLAAASGAFVGVLADRRTTGPTTGYSTPIVNTYRVEEVHKGSIGATIEVHGVYTGGASCGLDHAVGTRVAMYLRQHEGRWMGALCDTTLPEWMRAAAASAAPKKPVVRRKAKKRRADKSRRPCAPRRSRVRG